MTAYVVPENVLKILEERSQIGEDTPSCVVTVKSKHTGHVWKQIPHVTDLTASRHVGEADIATITIDNELGIYSPETKDENSEWKYVLTPNTEVNITVGYGEAQVQYFRGFIDTTNLGSYTAYIDLDCRSKYKLALDNYVTTVGESGQEFHTIVYKDSSIEQIFVDLALKAGWAEGEIYIEEDPTYRTGIVLDEFEVSWETYADAFTRLSEISQFEIICDEYGDLKLVYPTISQPAVVNQSITFENVNVFLYGVSNIVDGSELVISEDKSKTYKRNVDYYLYWDDLNGCIAIFRPDTSSIPEGATVLLSYVYPAYEFIEGETIVGVQYTLSDDDAYGKAAVFGEKQTIVVDETGNETTVSEVVEGYSSYERIGQIYYGDTILKLYNMPHKTLKIDSSIAQTNAQCQILADRALLMCVKRYRSCRHTAVAVPHLILGDTIQVYESSIAVSEAYRINGIELRLGSNGFIMDITSYHVGGFKVLGPGGAF